MKSNISILLWQTSVCLSCSQKAETKIFENGNIIKILFNEIKKDYEKRSVITYSSKLKTEMYKFFVEQKLYTTILSIYSLSTQEGKCEYLMIPDLLILLLQVVEDQEFTEDQEATEDLEDTEEYTLQTLVLGIVHNIFCVYCSDCDVINSDSNLFSSVYSPSIIIMNGELNPKEIQKCCFSLLNLFLSCLTSLGSRKHTKFLSVILPLKIESVLTTNSKKPNKFKLKSGTKVVLTV
jgi:hypothetical protein